MPKRKTSPCPDNRPDGPSPSSSRNITLASLDAALDMLACDTFARLDALMGKFEAASGVRVGEAQRKARWEEAVRRYWVMKSMDELCCGGSAASVGKDKDGVESGVGKGKVRERERERAGSGVGGDDSMDEEMSRKNALFRTQEDRRDEHGRALARPHPGAVAIHNLCPDEEMQWRRWQPRTGDMVLVDTAEDGIWPGKIIDRKTFLQGRTIPRGNHYFPVRIYNENIEPTLTIKSRLLPLPLRPTPPLLATTALLSAYNHASAPGGFDTLAHAREQAAAHKRLHPGVSLSAGDGTGAAEAARREQEKDKWKELVNWAMNERRGEKIRNLAEEREKRLRDVAAQPRLFPNTGGVSGLKMGSTGVGVRLDGEVVLEMEEIKGARINGSENGHSAGVGRAVRTAGQDKVGGNGPNMDTGDVPCPEGDAEFIKKKRKMGIPLPALPEPLHRPLNMRGISPDRSISGSSTSSSIFGPITTGTAGLRDPPTPMRRTASPLLSTLTRPGGPLATPTRPLSPRRLEKRRQAGVYSGIGEFSPTRVRAGSWVPPRILPSGDETAPVPAGLNRQMAASKGRSYGLISPALAGEGADGDVGMGEGGRASPVPTRTFDFVSPLGPVTAGRLNGAVPSYPDGSASGSNDGSDAASTGLRRTGSLGVELESVKEVPGEEGEEGWTMVEKKTTARLKSRPNGSLSAILGERESSSSNSDGGSLKRRGSAPDFTALRSGQAAHDRGSSKGVEKAGTDDVDVEL